jgi:hypothetical protein
VCDQFGERGDPGLGGDGAHDSGGGRRRRRSRPGSRRGRSRTRPGGFRSPHPHPA